MAKQDYWIADAEGAKALVTGPEDRDEWVKVRGWTETDEPVDGEFQYIRNVNHGGVGRMTHAAVALHAGLGWVPSGPPGYDEPAAARPRVPRPSPPAAATRARAPKGPASVAALPGRGHSSREGTT
jgi:hypothetical protein